MFVKQVCFYLFLGVPQTPGIFSREIFENIIISLGITRKKGKFGHTMVFEQLEQIS